MFYYFDNIHARATWLKLTNKLSTYDQTFVNIYTNNFGKNYCNHISKYLDENKICANEDHFIQIIDLLVLYYDTTHNTNIGVYINDIAHFMTELSDMGYHFTENDALYCIMYGFILPSFKVIDKTGDAYIELKNIVNYYLEDDSQFSAIGNKIPDKYMRSFDDPVFDSYVKVRNCKTIHKLSDLIRGQTTPNKIHLKIANTNTNIKPHSQRINVIFRKYGIY